MDDESFPTLVENKTRVENLKSDGEWDRTAYVSSEDLGKRALARRKETAKRLRAMFNGELY